MDVRSAWLGLALMLWLAMLTEGSTRPGFVQTTDGRTFSGEIHWQTNALLISSTNNDPASVALSELMSVTFDSATAPAAGKGNGFTGFYFGTTNFDGAAIIRLDESIDFNWGADAPLRGVGTDHFSIIWAAELEAPATGQFTFTVNADDHAHLFLSENLIVSARTRVGEAPRPASSEPIALEAGRRYPIKLMFTEGIGAARARLEWSGPGIPQGMLAREHLFASSLPPDHLVEAAASRGLLGTYYRNPELSGPSRSRVDADLDFAWESQNPMPDVSRTNLSVRWTGQVLAEYTEEYTFTVMADERVRLWVDDVLLIDRMQQSWLSESKGSLPLVAGERYDIRLQTQSVGSRPVAKLYWNSASISRTNIPSTHLFPTRPAGAGEATASRGGKLPPGVLLRSGTFLPCVVERATDTTLRASGRLEGHPLSTLQVARIICQPLSKAMEARITGSRPGVLLLRGDFTDGDFAGIENNQVKFGSVLFGLRKLDVKKEVLAINLREASPITAIFEVQLRDQTRLQAASLTADRDVLTVREPVLGEMKLPGAEVTSIKRRNAPGPAR